MREKSSLQCSYFLFELSRQLLLLRSHLLFMLLFQFLFRVFVMCEDRFLGPADQTSKTNVLLSRFLYVKFILPSVCSTAVTFQ